MMIKDAKFRDIYLKYVVILSKEDAEMNERMFNIAAIMDSIGDDGDLGEALKTFPIDNEVNAVVTVPYIDHQAGLSFLVLATALIEDNNLFIYRRNDFSAAIKVRRDKYEDDEFMLFEDFDSLNIQGEFSYYSDYAKDMLSGYSTEDLNTLRHFTLLDDARNEDNPDDVLVFFFKKGLKTEGMWVRHEKLTENYIEGILLNTPNQDFGISYGDKVIFNIKKDEEDGEYFCYAIVE